MTSLAQFAPVAAASLAAAVWQSALLALCVALGLRFLPGITATARSLIWSAVFLLTLALPFARFTSAGSSANAGRAGLHVDPRWALAVVALWGALSIVRGARLLHSAVRLYRVVRQSTPVAAPEVAELLAQANVSLCTSTLVDVPSVAGFFHPRILIPAALVGQIVPADLHQIVLHELEHLRRRDDWTNLLQKLSLALFPLNPVLLWVERRLCLERELACDDGVLRATRGAGKAYATCLANLAEASMLQRGLSLALGAWQRQSELGRRVHRILHNPAREMRPAQTAALAGFILAMLTGTGVLASRCPQFITFSNSASPAQPTAEAMAAPPNAPPLHPVPVKAVVPQARAIAAAYRVPRGHVRGTRAVARDMRRDASMPKVVLIGWPAEQFRVVRWAAPSSFQVAYAAVPTRAGWLFFQL